MGYFRDLISTVSTGRVCVVGEGLGASLVGFMMAQDTEGLVQCGVMINPVTDWRNVGKKKHMNIYNEST